MDFSEQQRRGVSNIAGCNDFLTGYQKKKSKSIESNKKIPHKQQMMNKLLDKITESNVSGKWNMLLCTFCIF